MKREKLLVGRTVSGQVRRGHFQCHRKVFLQVIRHGRLGAVRQVDRFHCPPRPRVAGSPLPPQEQDVKQMAGECDVSLPEQRIEHRALQHQRRQKGQLACRP